MRKDSDIRIVISSEKKAEFIKACDGRPMSQVIEKLIDAYIKKNKTKDG
jgi:hypothetical protein